MEVGFDGLYTRVNGLRNGKGKGEGKVTRGCRHGCKVTR